MGKTTELIRVRNFLNNEHIEIDDFELTEIKQAEQKLRMFQDIDELFIVAHETYIEFEEELSRITILNSAKLDVDFRTRGSEERIRINIRMISLLTAVKCYVDQTKGILSRLFPDDNSGAKFWGESIAEVRNDGFDFRIMELVRNSAQHHSLPVSYSRTNIKNDRSGDFPSKEVAMGFFLSKAAVADMNPINHKDKETQKELMRNGFERLDLVLLTRSYMQSICNLNNGLHKFTSQIFRQSCQVIDDLHDDMRDKLGLDEVDPVVGEDDFLYSSSGITFLRRRHKQTTLRFANKRLARLSHYPSDSGTYPSMSES